MHVFDVLLLKGVRNGVRRRRMRGDLQDSSDEVEEVEQDNDDLRHQLEEDLQKTCRRRVLRSARSPFLPRTKKTPVAKKKTAVPTKTSPVRKKKIVVAAAFWIRVEPLFSCNLFFWLD